mgnify:FL=1|tara:strand:+ start:716 stop:1276 length:561 start_codon:yes stop_codon:yes gene_type:complete
MGITIVDLKTGQKKKKGPPKTAKEVTEVKNPSTSDVYQKHKRKGGDSKLHSSRGRIGTATIKKNVAAAARKASDRSEKAIKKHALKSSDITKLAGYLNPTLAMSTTALKAAEPKPRPKRKPPVPKVPTITGPKAEPARRPTMKEQREAGNAVLIDYDQLENLSQKAGGGKVNYRMSGGQVVANCYD